MNSVQAFDLPTDNTDNSSEASSSRRFVLQENSPKLSISSYDGKSQRIEGFWNQCIIVATANNWDDETLKIQIIGNLRGEAANQLARLGPNLNNFSLQQLKEMLEAQFSYRTSKEEASRRLNQYQQYQRQSYLAMAQDLKDLVDAAYPRHPEELKQEELLKVFVQAIREPEVKRQLAFLHPQPTTMQEMVAHAERLQRLCVVGGLGMRLEPRNAFPNNNSNNVPNSSNSNNWRRPNNNTFGSNRNINSLQQNSENQSNDNLNQVSSTTNSSKKSGQKVQEHTH
jgi:hypothetical protein